jgi:hypothetical protein
MELTDKRADNFGIIIKYRFNVILCQYGKSESFRGKEI